VASLQASYPDNLETLAHAGACPRAVLDEALAWVREHQAELMKEWKLWHP
jgi:hypothetical protein